MITIYRPTNKDNVIIVLVLKTFYIEFEKAMYIDTVDYRIKFGIVLNKGE